MDIFDLLPHGTVLTKRKAFYRASVQNNVTLYQKVTYKAATALQTLTGLYDTLLGYGYIQIPAITQRPSTAQDRKNTGKTVRTANGQVRESDKK